MKPIFVALATVLLLLTCTLSAEAQLPSPGNSNDAAAQPAIAAVLSAMQKQYASRIAEPNLGTALSSVELMLNSGANRQKWQRQQQAEFAKGQINESTESALADSDRILIHNTKAMVETLLSITTPELASEFIADVHQQAIATGMVRAPSPDPNTLTKQEPPQPVEAEPKLPSMNISDYKGLAAHADTLPPTDVEVKNRFLRLSMKAAIKSARTGTPAATRIQARSFLKTLATKFKAIQNKLPDDSARQMCGMDIQVCLMVATE